MTRSSFLTILLCAVVCLLVPLSPASSTQTNVSYSATQKTPQIAANSTESPFVVIDTSGYEAGTYVLQLDLREDGWKLKTLTAVTLQGKPVRPQPVPDPTPEEPDETDPTPEDPAPLPDNQKLAAIQLEFVKIGKEATFNQQLIDMREALSLQENMADITAMHAWVQRGFEYALVEHSDLWLPWTTWFNDEADTATTAEDYRALVELALESLK